MPARWTGAPATKHQDARSHSSESISSWFYVFNKNNSLLRNVRQQHMLMTRTLQSPVPTIGKMSDENQSFKL